jgi:hypothetical protein
MEKEKIFQLGELQSSYTINVGIEKEDIED